MRQCNNAAMKLRSWLPAFAVVAFAACTTGARIVPPVLDPVPEPVLPTLAPEPPRYPDPVATHRFEIDAQHDDVVGEVQVTLVGKNDTLPDIARRFNVGYEEIVRANPGVDPWIPRVGTEVVVPTQ